MNAKKVFYISILLSLFLHFGSFVGLHYSTILSKNTQHKEQTVVIEILTPQNLNQQIVEQNKKSINNEIPEKAKYLGAFNQKVIKETKARKSGKFNNQAGMNFPKKGSPKKHHRKPRPLDLNDKNSLLTKLAPKMKWEKLAQRNQQGVERPGEESSSSDYLKDVDEGPQTMLNTKEFLYYSYFHRIKRQIHQHWEPQIKKKIQRLFSQGRQIASTHDRITKLQIILNQKGTLVGVQVVNESGVEDLDDAAIEAFRAAAPFPNPPKGIIDQNGEIKIQWDFVLEV